MTMRTYTCRGCGAPIIRIKTVGNKTMPCDPEQVTYWQDSRGAHKIVTPNGEVLSARLDGDLQKATGIGYMSHFATCPAADKFRRR